MTFDTGVVIGLAATALTFWANVRIGDKKAVGFLILIFGQLLWITRACMAGLLDLLVVSIIFLGLALYNFRKWSRSESSSNV